MKTTAMISKVPALLLIIAGVASAAMAYANAATPRCLTQEHEQVEFMVGSWDVVSRMRVSFDKDEWQETHAKATWSPMVGGCVLQEHWAGVLEGEDYEWIQLLAYDAREEKWELISADSAHGNLVDSEGFFMDETLTFHVTHFREGRLLIDRATVEKQNQDRFIWTMATSHDGGKNWVEFWVLDYTRR